MSDSSDTAEDIPGEPIEPEELVDELRRLRARIPRYRQLTAREARAMVRVAYLDPEFVDAGINATEVSEATAGLVGHTSDDLRSEQRDAGRWTAVEDELRAMLGGVSAANLDRRHRIGRIVLQIYAILRQLVRDKDHAHLLPWVETMKRTNRFGHKRKKSETAEGEPGTT
jgi:hypothetical protein